MVVFFAVILLPIALYLYLAHPAWTWMYAVDPASVSSVLLIPLLLLHGAVLIVGWWIGGRVVKAGRLRHGLWTAAAAAGVLLILTLIFSGRLTSYGSYDEWMAGKTVGLMDVKLGYALLVIGLGVGAAAVLVALQLLADSRRATSK